MLKQLRNVQHFDSVGHWRPAGGRPDGRGAMLTGPEFVVVETDPIPDQRAQTRELIQSINAANRANARR